ncbi:MAG: molybdopterin molybdotransferase MoeA [Pirellulaceae bacterium]
MISIDEALNRIGGNVRPMQCELIPCAQAVGRVLAEAALSDIDSPPHDKSMMDGFAVRSQDIEQPFATLRVVETITAGNVPQKTIHSGEAARIMTGAPVPPGADSIVMVEHTTMQGPEVVRIDVGGLKPGHHLMRRAESIRTGDSLFDVGHCLRPHDIGVLAETGNATVQVFRQPSIAILATGNELVDAIARPDAGQIRNSNGPMLEALAKSHATSVTNLGIATDDVQALKAKIDSGLSHDLLLLTGGVSAGIADLVPDTLKAAGVSEIFHKVEIKPGKPIWFGVRETAERTTYVFGLPGNPVSTLVCFEIFVKACLQCLSGGKPQRTHQMAVLGNKHSVRGPRTTYWPVHVQTDQTGTLVAEPLNWKGSSDLNCLSRANALACLGARETPFPIGSSVSVVML